MFTFSTQWTTKKRRKLLSARFAHNFLEMIVFISMRRRRAREKKTDRRQRACKIIKRTYCLWKMSCSLISKNTFRLTEIIKHLIRSINCSPCIPWNINNFLIVCMCVCVNVCISESPWSDINHNGTAFSSQKWNERKMIRTAKRKNAEWKRLYTLKMTSEILFSHIHRIQRIICASFYDHFSIKMWMHLWEVTNQN